MGETFEFQNRITDNFRNNLSRDCSTTLLEDSTRPGDKVPSKEIDLGKARLSGLVMDTSTQCREWTAPIPKLDLNLSTGSGARNYFDGKTFPLQQVQYDASEHNHWGGASASAKLLQDALKPVSAPEPFNLKSAPIPENAHQELDTKPDAKTPKPSSDNHNLPGVEITDEKLNQLIANYKRPYGLDFLTGKTPAELAGWRLWCDLPAAIIMAPVFYIGRPQFTLGLSGAYAGFRLVTRDLPGVFDSTLATDTRLGHGLNALIDVGMIAGSVAYIGSGKHSWTGFGVLMGGTVAKIGAQALDLYLSEKDHNEKQSLYWRREYWRKYGLPLGQ